MASTRIVVGHGEGSNFGLLERDGIRRPYHLVTMSPVWFEAGAEYGLPRHFFREKLPMLRFCLGKHALAICVRDGTEETAALAAALSAMGAVMFDIYPS